MTDTLRAVGTSVSGPAAHMDWREVAGLAGMITDAVARAFRGKPEVIEACAVTLLAGGHLIIEDFPGVGKTLLAKALARSVHCRFARIQFTPDLLPSDITGVNVFNQKKGEFEFRPGPIFANIVLADEINRASPKTQSSLLECMQEQQATIDTVTYRLAPPFMVIATQNPVEYEGTYALPEAQLDRFMMRLRLGYPTADDEIALLDEGTSSDLLARVPTVVSDTQVLAMAATARGVRAVESVRRYVVALTTASRSTADLFLGASPRAGLALLAAARVLALLRGRDYVVPQDIKDLAIRVLSHRVILSPEARMHGKTTESVLSDLLNSVPAPRG